MDSLTVMLIAWCQLVMSEQYHTCEARFCYMSMYPVQLLVMSLAWDVRDTSMRGVPEGCIRCALMTIEGCVRLPFGHWYGCYRCDKPHLRLQLLL